MQCLFCIIILFFTFTAYSQTRNLEIIAKDLSEDGTMVSSGNDELMLVMYAAKNTDKDVLSAPAFISSFDLDTIARSKTWNLELKEQSYVLFLIEKDDDRTEQQIDPVIRVYWQTIMTLFNEKKYTELSTYLGDNDLLGFVTFNRDNKESIVEIKGRQSLDTYHYLLKWISPKR